MGYSFLNLNNFCDLKLKEDFNDSKDKGERTQGVLSSYDGYSKLSFTNTDLEQQKTALYT
jgi:hypothetical protein